MSHKGQLWADSTRTAMVAMSERQLSPEKERRMLTAKTGWNMILTRASLTQELKQVRWLVWATGRQCTKACSHCSAEQGCQRVSSANELGQNELRMHEV